ncbi:MAG: hypothetical protein AAFV33_28575, partial [Chloroflexota bacterium]
ENQLQLNGAIVIQPLNDKQIVNYLDTLGADAAVIAELIERDTQLHELALSPLMLSVMILAFRGRAADTIPDFDETGAQRQHLFEVYVSRMLEWRGTDAFYTTTETQHYLNWLARSMQAQARSVFHIEDLRPDWLGDPKQLQMYFMLSRGSFVLIYIALNAITRWIVATFWGQLSVVTYTSLGVLLGIAMGGYISSQSPRFSRLPYMLLFGILYFMAEAVAMLLSWTGDPAGAGLAPYVVGFIGALGAVLGREYFLNVGNSLTDFKMVETVRWNISTWWRPRLILIGVSGSVSLNLAGLIAFPSTDLFDFLLGSLLTIPPMILLALVANTASNSQIDMRQRPNQGIRDSLITGARVGFILATLWSLVWLAASPSITTQYGFAFALA